MFCGAFRRLVPRHHRRVNPTAYNREFAAPIKLHFGPTEFDDQMASLKQALQQYPQLDASRLGFWGWSYCGYLTLYTLEKTDMFKAGV